MKVLEMMKNFLDELNGIFFKLPLNSSLINNEMEYCKNAAYKEEYSPVQNPYTFDNI
jgi:hypothetical protein